jgi:hypothetical protein
VLFPAVAVLWSADVSSVGAAWRRFQSVPMAIGQLPTANGQWLHEGRDIPGGREGVTHYIHRPDRTLLEL